MHEPIPTTEAPTGEPVAHNEFVTRTFDRFEKDIRALQAASAAICQFTTRIPDIEKALTSLSKTLGHFQQAERVRDEEMAALKSDNRALKDRTDRMVLQLELLEQQIHRQDGALPRTRATRGSAQGTQNRQRGRHETISDDASSHEDEVLDHPMADAPVDEVLPETAYESTTERESVRPSVAPRGRPLMPVSKTGKWTTVIIDRAARK